MSNNNFIFDINIYLRISKYMNDCENDKNRVIHQILINYRSNKIKIDYMKHLELYISKNNESKNLFENIKNNNFLQNEFEEKYVNIYINNEFCETNNI